MKTTTFVLVASLSLLSCKGQEQSPEEKAAEEKRVEKEIKRCKKALKTLASLEKKLNGTPPKMKSGVLEGTRNGYANFDVLLDDELSEPNESPKVRISTKQLFAECVKHVKAKTVSITDCSEPYVVVLKPGTFKVAKVSGDSYTPGEIDADAYVFDMSDGELVGGGHISAKTPESIKTKSSSAESDLREKLGQAAFDSLAEELNVKKK